MCQDPNVWRSNPSLFVTILLDNALLYFLQNSPKRPQSILSHCPWTIKKKRRLGSCQSEQFFPNASNIRAYFPAVKCPIVVFHPFAKSGFANAAFGINQEMYTPIVGFGRHIFDLEHPLKRVFRVVFKLIFQIQERREFYFG